MNEQFEEWLTGFCEGDGHLRVDRGYPKLLVAQKEREPLDYIALHFGFHLPIYNYKIGNQLIALGKKCTPLLEVLARHVVSEHTLERLNVLLELVALPLTACHEPTLDWLAGFWDAEGTSDRTPAISIVQKERSVVDSIGKQFGGSVGVRDGYWRWTLRGECARELIVLIGTRSHCATKRGRMYANFTTPTYSETNREKKKAYDMVYRETHREEQRVYHAKRYRALKAESVVGGVE
jgi:hypothetical protein